MITVPTEIVTTTAETITTQPSTPEPEVPVSKTTLDDTTTENSETTLSTTTVLEESSLKGDQIDNEVMSSNSNEDFAEIPLSNSKLRRSAANLVELNIIHKKLARRKSRSIVDYVIAKFYDDGYSSRPNQRPYLPVDRPSFLVYGKYREYNMDFMRYDAVLPFYYIPHLDTLALRFPLDNTNYYLLLLLPIHDQGIDQLICNLRFNGSLRYIIGNLRYQHVIATIPSFLLKGYVTLTPTFQKVIYFHTVSAI